MRRFGLALLLAVSTLWAQTTVRPRATEFVWLNSVTWSDSIAQPLKVIDQSVPGWCVEIFNESTTNTLNLSISARLLESGREVIDFTRGVTYPSMTYPAVYQSDTSISAGATGYAYIRTNFAPGIALKVASASASSTNTMTVVLRASDHNCVNDAIYMRRLSWPSETMYTTATSAPAAVGSVSYPGYIVQSQYIYAVCSAGSATLTVTTGSGGSTTLFSQAVGTTPISIPLSLTGSRGYSLNFTLSSCGTSNVGTLSATWTYLE